MNRAYVAAAGVVALMCLGGCEGRSGGPPLAGQGPSVSPQACPRIYKPVCGSRFGNSRTFPNGCEARASGYRIQSDGQCHGSGGDYGQPGGNYGQSGGDYGQSGGGGYGQSGGAGQGGGQQACPMVYRPVCAQRGSDKRTFPNSCRAESRGYDVLYQSECLGNSGSQQNGEANGGANDGNDNQAGSGGSDRIGSGDNAGGGMSVGNPQNGKPDTGQSCSRAFVPVCGANNGKKKTFINACMAQSKGYSIASKGRCQ